MAQLTTLLTLSVILAASIQPLHKPRVSDRISARLPRAIVPLNVTLRHSIKLHARALGTAEALAGESKKLILSRPAGSNVTITGCRGQEIQLPTDSVRSLQLALRIAWAFHLWRNTGTFKAPHLLVVVILSDRT
jgi:hypothetical protein